MDISRRAFVKATAVALASAAAAGSLALDDRLRGRRFGLHGRRVGRRGAEAHGRVPFLRLRMRRYLRSEGRPARDR